jgi:hypothetical protein
MPGGKRSGPLTRLGGVRILRAPDQQPRRSTNRSRDLPDLDIKAVAAAYERRVRQASPKQLALALALLERLPPARWTLEWYLPWWLGNAFGLNAAVSHEIVLSNVLGLGSIRLQDDLADGELPIDDADDARALSAALYDAALEPYRARFDARSPFWPQLERRMAAWHSASSLAARGAPIHVAATATCLIAGRMDAYPTLEACLDLVLEALVRYDHVADWEVDLDHGRWNAFVASVSPGPQAADARDRHRRTTYVAMLTSDAIAAWFEGVDHGLAQAVALADTLDPSVPPLAAHLRSFATGVRAQGAEIQERYRSLGDEAAKRMFPASANARS